MKSKNFIYLSRLDHLRFFAAILVVFFHFKGINFNNFTYSNIFEKFLGFGLSMDIPALVFF